MGKRVTILMSHPRGGRITLTSHPGCGRVTLMSHSMGESVTLTSHHGADVLHLYHSLVAGICVTIMSQGEEVDVLMTVAPALENETVTCAKTDACLQCVCVCLSPFGHERLWAPSAGEGISN